MNADGSNSGGAADGNAATGGGGDAGALTTAIGAALRDNALPGEDEDFGSERCAMAARLAAAALAARRPRQPGIVIENALLGDDEAGKARTTLVALANPDMPFLVDSVSAVFAAEGIAIRRLIHPVVVVARDADGGLHAVGPRADHADGQESLIYIEAERVDARGRRQLRERLEAVLADVRAAVEDWRKLQVALADSADRLAGHDRGWASGEGAALLRWLGDNNMTLLGHERIAADDGRHDRLGLSRASDLPMLSADGLRRARGWFAEGGAAPLLIKANRLSTVHRRSLLDLVIVPDGAALSIHSGLWTSAALAMAPDRVPVLRAQLSALYDKFRFARDGHAGKALAHALTTLPHDLVIGWPPAELERVALIAMSLTDRPRPKLAVVRSPLGRQLFAFVWLPRDDVSTGMRKRIQTMLASRTGGRLINWTMALEEGGVALVRFVFERIDRDAPVDEAALDAELAQMVRGWAPAVEAALAARMEPRRAAALAGRYAELLPDGYRTDTPCDEAADDIERLAALDRQGGARDVRLTRRPEDPATLLRLKVIERGGALALSDVVPVLEHFGFRVTEEIPSDIAADEESAAATLHHFILAASEDRASAMLGRADEVEAAIGAAIAGEAENDPFNQLLGIAGIDAEEVVWLRAIFHYLRQAGMRASLATTVQALSRVPQVTNGIVDLFRALHQPDLDGDRDAAVAAADRAIDEGLVAVKAIDEDLVLRSYAALVRATLRTNAFVPAGAEALAFKIDSGAVPRLPAPVPWREIFLYSPRVEGIHLRAGPVARGGLRWSDRRDDYRTEILGLMKAQRVKNAVIVPTGAKGGFYPRRLPDPAVDRDGWATEGREAYKVFIRGLLSVTDNIVEGRIVHPDGMVIRDGDDPYFVVAADKGTASFSDTANAIAEDAHFWLDDAFASGGSNGYDHKAMGITARGAWISVQRHFREAGIDVQADPVTVAGVGDMSGDVFGNGMLLSKAIRLVAAFDHRHIFLDPDPDPAASWAERSRLFALPRSSWDDYDRAKLSPGGGIFARSEKSIPLSPQVGALLGIEADAIDPASLMSAILKADVGLLWFGGIGTYVKAAHENHVEVGDPANDAIRVDAEDMRARVIGEGANLGITQAGRIEFAGRGGRINTDFIDNSAGVDCSDKEVNIKIALADAKARGALDEDGRRALLADMTDAVAELVLEDNRLQTLVLSIAEAGGADSVPAYVRMIGLFEETGRLDRAVEGLAPDEELLRRAEDGDGLTRPELAVLLATAKLGVQDSIERGTLATDPALEADLFEAFPPQMRAEFADSIRTHRLRGEIIATRIANRLVNRLGLLAPYELAEEEGVAVELVARAFVTVERLFDLPRLWDSIELAEMTETARIALFASLTRTTRTQMADLIRTGRCDAPVDELVAMLGPAIAALTRDLDDLLAPDIAAHIAADEAALVDLGASAELAARVERLERLDGAIGIAELAARQDADSRAVAGAFTLIGERLGLGWAQSMAARMTLRDPWERTLAAGLARDLQRMRIDFLGRATGDPVGFAERWLDDQAGRVAQFNDLVVRARAASGTSVAMLAQIAGQARVLLAR